MAHVPLKNEAQKGRRIGESKSSLELLYITKPLLRAWLPFAAHCPSHLYF